LRNNTSKIKTGPFADCKGVHDKYFKMGDEIYKFLRRKLEVSQYLCKTYSPFVDFLIKELSLSFKQKNMNQLELLKVTGFCLSTTVKSPQKFGMCMGASSFGQNKSLILQQARFNVVQVKAWSISLTYAATKRDGFDAFHGNFVQKKTKKFKS
jgi:hypothetical protein